MGTYPGDKHFITHPDLWAWPGLLPLKKPSKDGGWPEHAVLLDHPKRCTKVNGLIDPAQQIIIYLGSMFDPGWRETVTYPNLDALLADGWKVD